MVSNARFTVSLFFVLLNSQAVLSDSYGQQRPISGQEIFETYCSLCHGLTGRGDGRLAQVIAEPPPANLVKSNKPKHYIQMIVSRGGAAMGRSEKMPSWAGELGEGGVEAVVDYVFSLRN